MTRFYCSINRQGRCTAIYQFDENGSTVEYKFIRRPTDTIVINTKEPSKWSGRLPKNWMIV